MSTLALRLHPIQQMRSARVGPFLCVLLAHLLALGACGRNQGEERVAQHAAKVLGVPASSLRVTTQSELTGTSHDFFLATTDDGKSLVVVVPKKGEMFDARTPDAFEHVSRGEHATQRLSQLGAERVASWFAALGSNVCPLPPGDQAHFVEVTHQPDGGVQLSYAAAHRICVINLRPDGSLVSAKTAQALGPSAAAPRWQTTPGGQ